MLSKNWKSPEIHRQTKATIRLIHIASREDETCQSVDLLCLLWNTDMVYQIKQHYFGREREEDIGVFVCLNTTWISKNHSPASDY